MSRFATLPPPIKDSDTTFEPGRTTEPRFGNNFSKICWRSGLLRPQASCLVRSPPKPLSIPTTRLAGARREQPRYAHHASLVLPNEDLENSIARRAQASGSTCGELSSKVTSESMICVERRPKDHPTVRGYQSLNAAVNIARASMGDMEHILAHRDGQSSS
jgi:hypothetical protein